MREGAQHAPALSLALVALGALAVRRVAPAARFVRRSLLKGLDRKNRVRARIFGPACSGEHGPALLGALVRHASNEAAHRGFDFVVTNLDADDPRRAVFPKAKFYTTFLQKALGRVYIGGDAPRFDAGAFHDPRDIS